MPFGPDLGQQRLDGGADRSTLGRAGVASLTYLSRWGCEIISRCGQFPAGVDKVNIRQVVQESDTVARRSFDSATPFLIALSVASLSVETLPGLSPVARRTLDVSEVVITVLFTIEYGLRIATSPKKLGYIFSFPGLIDLVAVLPFYFSLGIDLRSIRAFRLFRIFRILKITRYSVAMERLGDYIG